MLRDERFGSSVEGCTLRLSDDCVDTLQFWLRLRAETILFSLIEEERWVDASHELEAEARAAVGRWNDILSKEHEEARERAPQSRSLEFGNELSLCVPRHEGDH